MPREQVGISLSPQERELVEAIAKDLGRPLAAVLRDCAMEGIDAFLEKIERRQKYLNNKNANTPNV